MSRSRPEPFALALLRSFLGLKFRFFTLLVFRARIFALLVFALVLLRSQFPIALVRLYIYTYIYTTGRAEYDRQNRSSSTGQAERDRQNGTGRTGQAERDRQNGTGRTG
jgi:hypothetical protein